MPIGDQLFQRLLRHRLRHQDPGRADAVHQADAVRAHLLPHRTASRADREGRGPRPLVHRGGGQGVRLRRPGDPQRRRGAHRGAGVMINPKEPNVSEHSLRSPQSRYVLPSFVERTSYGIKEMNPYNKLFEERIIFLGVQIDDASANDVMAQLLTLEAIDPDRDITMYINSPGGSMTSMMAIYDTMQFIQPDITTCCLGQAASAAAVSLAAGSTGNRVSRPNARILIHQPATEGGYGPSRDVEIQAREILRMRAAMEVILSRHTGQDEEKVRRDIERDKFLTAEEAKEYGIIDEVLTMIKRGSEPAAEVVSSLPGEFSSSLSGC